MRATRAASKIWRGGPSSMTRPWSNTTTRSATRRAKSISWVTTTMVMPSSASAFMTLSTSPMVSGSSAEVGSSNSIRAGSIASARAIATRCCWPPESCAGMLSALSDKPDLGQQGHRARSSASARRASSTVRGPIATLLSAVRCGNSSKFWNTMPMRRRIAAHVAPLGAGRPRRRTGCARHPAAPAR